jgi:predicted RNase H-like nuclease (RuvC/YqgF family)
MKRSTSILGLLLLTALVTGVMAAQEQSLADAARQHKQQKEGKPVATKVFTNDNLPSTETISTVGEPTSDATPDANAATDPAAAADASKTGPDGKPIDPIKEQKKTWEDWHEKIQKQKAAVEQLQKDNEEIEKQYRLTLSNYYNSANQRINDGAQITKEDTAYREQMEQKKKAIEDGKQKIDDLQEEARRAGVPAGFRD